jgi:hypothetical protein
VAWRAPLRLELRVRKDRVHKVRAVARRVAVHRARDRLYLALHRRRFLRVFAHDRHRADALAVHAHVLCVRLAQSHWQAFGEEALDRGAVALAVARRKALRVRRWA